MFNWIKQLAQVVRQRRRGSGVDWQWRLRVCPQLGDNTRMLLYSETWFGFLGGFVSTFLVEFHSFCLKLQILHDLTIPLQKNNKCRNDCSIFYHGKIAQPQAAGSVDWDLLHGARSRPGRFRSPAAEAARAASAAKAAPCEAQGMSTGDPTRFYLREIWLCLKTLVP